MSIALLTAGFATFSLLYSVQPLLPLFTQDFGVSAAAASLAVSVATGPMAVALLVAGVLSDRIGRRPLMIGSLFAAAVLTLASGLLPGWHALLAMRLLTGVALAGVPAVAMAYVAEEVDAGSIGSAMGLYVAGTAVGGMSGRLGVSLLAEWVSWRTALVALGLVGLVAALLFLRLAPPSRRFVARRHDLASFVGGLRRLFRDPALPWLYVEAFLLMGAFVTIYNFAGFRLIAPPYGLGHGAVGAIFLLYLVGSFSSAWVGGLAGRLGRRRVLWMPIVVLLAGVALTAARPLWLVIIGIGVVTAGFFGAHSVASSWVGRRGRQDRGQAAALYLFFYYLGSSVLGSTGGFAWADGGWPGVSLFTGGLAMTALAIAALLARVPPLPENLVVAEPEEVPVG
jgi:YNFM family putative membrane transporter